MENSNNAPRPVSLCPAEVDLFRQLTRVRGLMPEDPMPSRGPRLRFASFEIGVLILIGVVCQAVTR